jgi:hypothetical protein
MGADCLANVGVSVSHNPVDLHGLLTGTALPFTFSRYIFVVLRFLLAYIQLVLLRSVNRIFITVSTEVLIKC